MHGCEAASVRRPVGPTLSDNCDLACHSKKFRIFVRRLEDTFGISLPDVQFDSVKEMKQFCSGLLLPSSAHPWARPVRKLFLRDRLSIAGSLFLFRKVLPSSPPSIPAYLDKMSTPSPPPAPGYLDFCDRMVDQMFGTAWDRGWEMCVKNSCVRQSSCLEKGRKQGGARGLLLNDFDHRADFISSCLSKYESLRLTDAEKRRVDFVRVATAPCDGKVRLVTVNSFDMTFLTPLHTLVYNHISKQDWCLRGEATAHRFSDFFQMPGEVFVSGDYESATDNLNMEVAQRILHRILSRASRIPTWIRELAKGTLGGTLSYMGKEVLQKRGQLMGNALSFPLLCLQNYFAFKFFVPRPVPVRINGDDIVFRGTPDEYERWKCGVQACGLVLSEGKTLVAKNHFSLNSTFFVSGTKRVRLAPVIRSTALFKKWDFYNLKGRVETFRGFRPDRRDRLVSYCLGNARSTITASRRSLTRGLEMKLSKKVIHQSGLAERESYYLSLDKMYDAPLQVAQIGYLRHRVPEGWVRVRSTDPVNEEEQRLFFEELVAATWKPEIRGDTVSKGAVPALNFRPFPVRPSLLRQVGLSRRAIHRRLWAFEKQRKWGTCRWVKRSESVGAAVRRADLDGSACKIRMVKGETFSYRVSTRMFYNFLPPPESSFPSTFHRLDADLH